MKSIYFKSAHLLSIRDKKGFFYEFSPDINIILGSNDTGKSSLIKSLYYTLGADIRLDKKWRDDNFISKVVIHVNNKDYAFIRHDKTISIFNLSNNKKHLVTSSSRSDIALIVKEIFDFNLELVIKSTAVQAQALPSALYLPYYIDQDNGWGKVLDSFANLAMYMNWQNSILHFHAGIKPKEYYKLQGDINIVQLQIEEKEVNLRALLSAQKKFEDSFGRVLFDIDVNYYEELLERFLKKCQDLNHRETAYRLELIDALSKRDNIEAEIKESKRQMSDSDINSISNVENYIDKYQILEHREKLLQIIPELYHSKNFYDAEIEKIKDKLKGAQKLSFELNTMLKEVKEKLTLQDIINTQASKQVETTFDEQINEISIEIGQLEKKRVGFEEDISKYTDIKRTKLINNIFKENLRYACRELGIHNPAIKPIINYSTITKSETGSRAPRAILAYHYALLKTIENKSTIPMLPVVIDSPKQQDVDPEISKKIFDLCINGLSDKNQLVIGSVSIDRDISEYNNIVLENKYSLLRSEQYEEVYQQIMPLYESAF